MRPGIKTSEFWATLIIQVVLIVNAVFDAGIDIPDETAMAIAGGITAAYAAGRSVVKALETKKS